MSKQSTAYLLTDILDVITATEDFVSGIDYPAFLEDRKTRDAVVRNIQIIGEAANRISIEFWNDYQEIE